MTVSFYKYQGTGNDFVLIDNRNEEFPSQDTALVAKLCDRKFGIGADGLILLENDPEADFKMLYYNSDGNESSMCGNGGRCTVAFAKHLGMIADKTTFMAIDGVHYAEIKNDIVNLQMQNVPEVIAKDDYVFLDTGSPHHVVFKDNIGDFDIQKEGAAIRYGEPYNEAGTNVNFVKQIDEKTFRVRTYERGVERETLSCGTGVTAVAIAMHYNTATTQKHIVLQTEGGRLEVSFEKTDNGYESIYLKGPAIQVFKGKITC